MKTDKTLPQQRQTRQQQQTRWYQDKTIRVVLVIAAASMLLSVLALLYMTYKDTQYIDAMLSVGGTLPH